MADPQVSEALRTSPAALAALAELPNLSAAPDPYSAGLRATLAARYGLPPEAFVVGVGAAGLLHHLIARAASRGPGEVVYSDPSFHLYAALTRDYQLTGRPVPLRDYRHDVDALIDALSEQTRLMLLDSPHNITGTTINQADLRTLAEKLPPGAVVVLDNVYGEYQDDDIDHLLGDILSLGLPIIFCRSFSKVHRLFGLRAGYMIGPPRLLESFGPIVLRYDVGTLTQTAAAAALADRDTVDANQQLVADTRRQLYAVLDRAGIPYVESQSDSVLVDVRDRAKYLAHRLFLAGCGLRGSPHTRGIPAGHIQLFVDDADVPDIVAGVLAAETEPDKP